MHHAPIPSYNPTDPDHWFCKTEWVYSTKLCQIHHAVDLCDLFLQSEMKALVATFYYSTYYNLLKKKSNKALTRRFQIRYLLVEDLIYLNIPIACHST